jgi:hypothetical protein
MESKLVLSKKSNSKVRPSKQISQKPMTVFHGVVMNYLSSMFGPDSSEALIGKFRALKEIEPSKFNSTRSLFRNMSKDVFGTWMPKIKFYTTPNAVTPTAGILTTVNRLRAADLAYFNSFSGIFDEYRFSGPVRAFFRSTYAPTAAASSIAYGTGAVDLVDGTAMASVAGALMYDTAKIFPLNNPYRHPEEVWDTRLLGQPDLIWEDTSVQNVDVAWWKVYNFANLTGAVTYGYVNWEAEIEFRQLYGI